jgi:hypothetical protein
LAASIVHVEVEEEVSFVELHLDEELLAHHHHPHPAPNLGKEWEVCEEKHCHS